MVDEDTFLVAALAAASSQEINKNLDRRDQRGFSQLAATLNHRDILQGHHNGNINKLTRGEIIRQGGYQAPPVNYPQPTPPRYNVPPAMVNHDFQTENLIDANVNSIPLGTTDAHFIPMPVVANGGVQHPSIVPTPIVTDFQIPNFGNPSAPTNTPQKNAFSTSEQMSSVVLLQGIEQILNDVLDIAQKNEKKINRIERKINEIYKYLNINPKDKNDSI